MKNLQHVWSIICSKSTTDNETKNISLFNLIEKITITTDKTPKQKSIIASIEFELVTRIRKITKKKEVIFDYRVYFIDSSGERVLLGNKQLKDLTTKVVFPNNLDNLRLRSNFNGILVNKEGLHYFIVETKEEDSKKFLEVARVPLEIKFEK